MRLTKRNYHSKKNTMISNSKVSQYLKSKEIYKRKYIDCDYNDELSVSLKIGRIVDSILSTGNFKEARKEFSIKVLKKDNEEEYNRQQHMHNDNLISQKDWDTAIKMAFKVMQSKLYEWYKQNKAQFQVPFSDTYDGVGVCGLLDAMVILPDVIYIDDFKTANASSIESINHWYWHCKKYGYFRQLAHYKNLVAQKYPDHKIVCRHLVIGNSKELNYPIKLFVIDDSALSGKLEEFKSVCQQIKNETSWVDDVPTWENAQTIYDIYNSTQPIHISEESES